MRPLQLTMQAFGSYGKKTTVDFTKTNQNLFLITGDTGAGKTTIFDALVFAIYGEASSGNNKKDGCELQSQFVEYDTEPFVELTFSETDGGEAVYTVRRVPRHVRPLKKGTGVKEEKETVSLTMADGSEYSQNQKETDKKLEAIVGLTKNQFMQVAMIAQGEFMELLRAKSDDKKMIFRKLFGTELFEEIVSELARRRKEKSVEIAQIRTVCQTKAGEVKVPEDWPQAEELLKLQKMIVSAERLNIAELEAFLEGLASLCGSLEAERAEADAVCADRQRIRDDARDRLTRGQALLRSFEELERAEQKLREYADQEPEIRETERKIRAIRDSYDIQAVYRRFADAEEAVRKGEAERGEQKEKLPGLTEASQRTAERETAARAALDREMDVFTRTEERVKKALAVLEKIQAAEENVKKAENAVNASQDRLDAARKMRDDFEIQEQEQRRQAEALSDTDAQLTRWEAKDREARSMADDLAEIKGKRKEAEVQQRLAKQAREEYKKAREQYLWKNEIYQQRQKEFLDAQAGLLAAELRPGIPCPVCGSLEHPSPCALSGQHQELTRQMIEELSKEAERLNREQSEKSTAAGAAGERLAEMEKQLDGMTAKLWERAERIIEDAGQAPWNVGLDDVQERGDADRAGVQERLNLEMAETFLDRWQSALREEGKLLRDRALTLSRLREALSHAEEEKAGHREDVETAQQRLTEAKEIFASAKAGVKALEVQQDYATRQEAESVRRAAETAKQEKQDAYDSFCQAARRARTAKENAETRIRQCEEALPGQQKERDARYADYERLMAEKALAEPEWMRLTEQYEKSEVSGLQSRVDHFSEGKAAAQGARDTARQAADGHERPDLDRLEEDVKRAEEQLSAAKERLDQRKELCRINRAAYDALAPRMGERGQMVREYARIDSLYNRLAGKVSGGRMDIETFVQRCYLQRILHAANARFLDMSAGQFELRMVGEDQAGEGRNRGLDLMVYSAVTGKEREVRTLSGGESFMAALSLALGMADQIQERSASIHLDMMFIDEGFGSLDEHAREQAVRVLQRMASGSKLIGIISHVTELKQEIEDQLIVRKGKDGSSVVWQIS